MNEFSPPSTIFNLRQARKTAWTEETLPKENTSSFYRSFCQFATLYKYFGSFPVEHTNSSINLKFSYTSILTVTSAFLPIVTNFTLQIFYPQDDSMDQLISLVSNLSPLLSKLLFFARFPSLIKLIQLMKEIDGSRCLKTPDPNLPKKNNRFVQLLGLCFWLIIIFPHVLIQHGPVPEVVNGYVLHVTLSTILLTQMSFLYVICYQMGYFFDRFHAELEKLVELGSEEVRQIYFMGDIRIDFL